MVQLPDLVMAIYNHFKKQIDNQRSQHLQTTTSIELSPNSTPSLREFGAKEIKGLDGIVISPKSKIPLPIGKIKMTNKSFEKVVEEPIS